MRKIRFRAWDIAEKRMWWNVQNAYDTLGCHNIPEDKDDCDCKEHMFLPSSFGGVLDDSNYIVMQSTGLRDKNGKEIYEGDILTGGLTIDSKLCCSCGCCHVVWGWGIEQKYENDGKLEDDEVIGNIYENPELVKK